MDWTSYFDSLTLRKGIEYYRKGKVKGFVQTADGCMARVLGTHIYNVRVAGLKIGHLMFTCSCPIGVSGRLCKHEAAVMYQWGAENSELSVPEDELESGEGKTYFNVRKVMQNSGIDPHTIEKAYRIVEEDRISITKTNLRYTSRYDVDGGELAISFEGESRDENNRTIFVKVEFTQSVIVNSFCTYDHRAKSSYGFYYSMYDEICEHRTALLLLADKYIAKYNPGDDTDYIGNKILKGYKKLTSIQKIEDTITATPIVRLQPRIRINYNNKYPELSVSFKIGIEKLYVLKSIPRLIEAHKQHKSMKFGKSYILSFMDNDFDEKSKEYYSIIEAVKEETDYIQNKYGMGRNYFSDDYSVITDEIDLSAEHLDTFYDIAYGEMLEISGLRIEGGGEVRRIKIGSGNVKAKVYISSTEEQFNGLYVEAYVPLIIRGKNYNYSIDNETGTLTRLEKISPMMELLIENANNGLSEFTIGEKNISEFYYRLLPQMMESSDIEVIEPEDLKLESVLPPECKLSFYMDADEDYIIGRVSATYGEEEIFLHELRDSDYPLPVSRDTTFEQSGVQTLMHYLPTTSDDGETFLCEKSGDNVFDLLSEGLKDLMAYGEIKASKDFEKLKIRKTPSVRLGVSVESGILNLEVTTEEMSEEELLDLLESYRKNKKFFKLRNGEFIRLDRDDTLEELMMTMEAMGVSVKEFTKGKLHLPLYRAVYINKLLEEHDDIAADRDKNFKNIVRNFNTIKDADIDVPKSLERVLRGYQKYGFKWLTMISELGFGGILADDMGLGKTLQVIAMLLYRKEHLERRTDTKLSALIVCPASLVYNWEEEFKRFAPSIEVQTVTGTQAERKKLLSKKVLPEVLVTSYDLLKRDIAHYEKHTFDYEIIDEAQYIKNAQAAASKSVKIIKGRHRFALTGTPIENRLSELWSIFDYLMPGFLYTYDRFKTDFETSITKFKDEAVTKQLRNMVGPFILRRLKGDVLKDLPDKIEEIRYSKFDSEQRKLYDAQVTHMKKVLESEEYRSGKDRLKVLAELTRIRQICCDPELITAGYKGESAKRLSCIELVQSAIDGGHKILLFSQFTSMLELLEKDLKAEHIEYYKITGQTSKEERIKLVRNFNENDIPLFLISLKAGGTGLNLTGADVVIHYDPWWNLAAQNQATDRAHRIGQTKNVSVFKLIAKDTIEEKIIEMQNAKKDLADAILSGDSESITNMTKEQLLELLG
ncbi:DEAD/DEAH box helicase [Butyrivibrio sp. WCE2006]|uniref:DEAD/DEAH box helicase n=1 Tax=Butyrivibrio sp. WCE2006 TaxID=1410611 RepID=UPI00067928C9|nr:DEAD/DEAH box helicase [Butyrivibrio sp. WCE2006]